MDTPLEHAATAKPLRGALGCRTAPKRQTRWAWLLRGCPRCEPPKRGEIWEERNPMFLPPTRYEIEDVSADGYWIKYNFCRPPLKPGQVACPRGPYALDDVDTFTRYHTKSYNQLSPRLMLTAIKESLWRGGFRREFSYLVEATLRHNKMSEVIELDK